MAKEIERKFLVKDVSYREAASSSVEIAQGYLCREPDTTVRIRVAGECGYITVKSRNHGATRNEWEYQINVDDAREMLALCSGVLSKTRFFVPGSDGLLWEVDEFRGALAGLVVAEIELPSEHATFALPSFAGREVTGEPEYYNSNLAARV